jgi:hypothetical protein
MADKGNVFISWSGERSRIAAETFREWLGNVLQNARPWMSESDIEKGSRGLDEIAKALEGMKVGIICLTPENLSAEWLLYEAGALSKTRDAKTRVCTYLLAGLEPTNLKPPLSLFQATKANKSDTQKLIGTINNHLDATPLSESTLNSTFEKWWPDLEKILTTLPSPSKTPPPRPDTSEMVEEILEISRFIAPEILEMKDQIPTTSHLRELIRDEITNQARTAGGLAALAGQSSGYLTLSQLLKGLDPASAATSSTTPPAVTSSESSVEPTKRRHVSPRPRQVDKK